MTTKAGQSSNFQSASMKARVALLNEIRSTLAEFSIVCKTLGANCTRSTLLETIHDESKSFPALLSQLLQLLAERLDTLDGELKRLDAMLECSCQERELVQRLMAIEGVGPITASAMVCGIPDIRTFESGRDFAAWAGLTPRQHSSGGKENLGGITKRGDSYLRTLLIHGARAVVSKKYLFFLLNLFTIRVPRY